MMKEKVKKSPINTIIFSSSPNDSEQVASHLKNMGLPIRHQVISDSEQLKEALQTKHWQQAIFINELDNLPIKLALKQLRSQPYAVPAILLSDDYNEERRFDKISQGLSDCIPTKSLDLLALLIKREQQLVNSLQSLEQANKIVYETNKRNELLLDSSKDAIAYIHDGMHIYTNPTYIKRFGYEEDEIIVMTIMDIIAEEDKDKIKALLKRQAQEGTEVSEALKGKTASGEIFEADFIISSAIYDDEDCVQLLVRDIGDQQELMKKLKEVSQLDQVTGALNRPAFMEHLKQAVTTARNHNHEALVYLLEIDKFTEYRSKFGLSDCDALLKDVAGWLRDHIDSSDVIGRISDSSFAILLDNTDKGPMELPKKLCEEVEQQMFEVSGQTLNVTFSIGGVPSKDNDVEPGKLLLHATTVAHNLQEEGGNKYQIFNPSIDSLLTEKERKIFEEFTMAREEGKMTLFYQPMMSLKGSPNKQYMCYFRYQLQNGSWGLGEDIFPIFEKVGIDAEIDKITIKHSLKVLAKDKASGNDNKLFLALNPNTLIREDLEKWLAKLISVSGIEPNNLILTLKGHIAQSYLKRVVELKNALRKINIPFCLSGIDIGDSELVKSIRPKFVIFAPTFVETLKEGGSEKVQSVIDASAEVEARTVISNLEDASSLAQIWPLGIDFVMGNYVSKPIPKLNYDFADSDF
ncbi:EAL domain-containing protein [Kangiella sediminilitoris]|uniref:Diguanylate cyclase/phosphodiesterase with PAS/PAC sensor(S) n=1 Tax=Kangiella sediminilitoris TaxID=1144748 RepID=A0A1B3B918_9GAMM|nr:EAL domain-containing protein [Kangiella sediminilitoris]AOE49283.1 Diguanylate cyclase/phosphodiesterase with PAS/PAC sensor(S) [Kangiella sediminilitoris]